MWRQRVSSRYLSGRLPYVLSVSLNKTFPSFLFYNGRLNIKV